MLPWLWKNIGHYDVVHIHALFSFASTGASLIARYKKVPYIIRPLGTLNKYGLKNRRPFSKRWSMFFIEKGILENAAGIHCTSDKEKADIDELSPGLAITVLPLAASPVPVMDRGIAVKQFPMLADKRWLIFMSRLDPVKNIELLLHAFKLSVAELPVDMLLLIAGEGSEAYRRILVNLAEQLDIADRVVWAGHLQGDVKAAALGGAELFILPSQSENFAIAAVEAMSAGVPCALSRGVAIAQAASEAGAAVILDIDATVFAAQIVHLIDDLDLRKKLSENAMKFASAHYSIEIMGESLKQLYDNIVSVSKGIQAGP